MGDINYAHLEPDSHFWSTIDQLIVNLGLNTPEITKDYIIRGLVNTFNNGYELNKVGEVKSNLEFPGIIIFDSIWSIVDYVSEVKEFNISTFMTMLYATRERGFNFKCERTMERSEVYKNIDTEREYQDMRWGRERSNKGSSDSEKPPAEWINYIEYHISEAKKAAYELDDDEALAQVRKVAALAVRCLELHGCPERIIPTELNK